MATSCLQCGSVVPSSSDRPPPWCPRCGADLKPGATPQDGAATANIAGEPALVAPRQSEAPLQRFPWQIRLSWREPLMHGDSTAPLPPPVQIADDDGSLDGAINKVACERERRRREAQRNRRAGAGFFFGGLGVMAAGLAVFWLFSHFGVGGYKIIISLFLIGFGLAGGGLYAMLTGQAIFVGGVHWDVTLDAAGIERTPVGGLIDGWRIPWSQIACLEYVEDYPFADQVFRVLIVHTLSGRRETLLVADEITPAQLAETTLACGKRIEARSVWEAAGAGAS